MAKYNKRVESDDRIVWGSNPKKTNLNSSYREANLIIENRFSFGKQAPILLRNVAHLEIGKQPNYFKIDKSNLSKNKDGWDY